MDITAVKAGGRGFAPSAGGSRTCQPGDHHGRVDRLPGARSESTDCRRRHRRQYLLALAYARSTRSGRGPPGCVENRQRRNPCWGNHQSDPPAVPQWALVDVNEVIREMIVLLRSEATRYSISVRTELADLPQVMGDRVQLQQVLMNLMTNGIDAMKDVDGTRELAIKSQRAEDRQLLISVSDTGVGLPRQQADQIFNAFFTTKLQGTGMGLRISRSIVESHGGRLWAADNSQRGASFYIALPTQSRGA